MEASSKREKARKKDKTKEIQTPVVEPQINFGGAQPCQRRWIGPKEMVTRRGVTEPRVYWEASQPSPDKNTLCSQRHFQAPRERGGSCKTGVIIPGHQWGRKVKQGARLFCCGSCQQPTSSEIGAREQGITNAVLRHPGRDEGLRVLQKSLEQARCHCGNRVPIVGSAATGCRTSTCDREFDVVWKIKRSGAGSLPATSHKLQQQCRDFASQRRAASSQRPCQAPVIQ